MTPPTALLWQTHGFNVHTTTAAAAIASASNLPPAAPAPCLSKVAVVARTSGGNYGLLLRSWTRTRTRKEATVTAKPILHAHLLRRLRGTQSSSSSSSSSSTELSGTFAIQGIDVLEGTGGLPKIRLHNKDKSEAEIYLHGGVVTSWKSKGKELLHVRPDAVFDGKKPISGGMPHCFPQFGPGPLQQHGFARNVSWTVASSSNENDTPSVTLELRDGAYSRAMWDYKFLVKYTVSLEGEKLRTELVVKNVDSKPFSFTTAIHSYFSAVVGGAVITGLNGLKAFDKHPVTKEPMETLETRDLVTFGGFTDRVYLDAPSRLVLRNGHGDTIAVENEGWSDAVVWNPHLTMKLYYKDFVCIENAKLFPPVKLQPRQKWHAKSLFGPIDVPDVTCPPAAQLEQLLDAVDSIKP